MLAQKILQQYLVENNIENDSILEDYMNWFGEKLKDKEFCAQFLKRYLLENYNCYAIGFISQDSFEVYDGKSYYENKNSENY